MIVILVRLLQKVLGDLCGECNMGRRLISATPWGFSHALKIVDAVLRGIAQVLDNSCHIYFCLGNIIHIQPCPEGHIPTCGTVNIEANHFTGVFCQ